MITQKYSINLIPKDVPVIVNASQYDKESRTIEFDIYDGNSLFDIPSGATVSVVGTKPDKTGFTYACNIGSGGYSAYFNIKQQMTVLAGKVPCELRIASGSELIGTANFILNVEKSALDDDTIISETDISLIEQGIEAAEQAEQSAQAAADAVDEAREVVADVQIDLNDIKAKMPTTQQTVSTSSVPIPYSAYVMLTDTPPASGQPYGNLLGFGNGTSKSFIFADSSDRVFIKNNSNAWQEITEQKYYYGSIGQTINGNTDTTISIPTPSGANEVKALIPLGYSVTSDWNTRLIFKEVTNLSTISIRTQGSTNQTYAIRYLIIYV